MTNEEYYQYLKERGWDVRANTYKNTDNKIKTDWNDVWEYLRIILLFMIIFIPIFLDFCF